MLFVNQYTHTTPHQYNYAIEFIERRSFIYTLGQLDGNKGLITKLNRKGRVKWERSYRIGDIDVQFEQIVSVNQSFTRKQTYIVYAVSNDRTRHFLLSIDFNGTVKWCHEYTAGAVDKAFILENQNDSTFYLVLSKSLETPTSTSSIIIVKFDKNGNRLATKKLHDPDYGLHLKQCRSYNKGIIIMAEYVTRTYAKAVVYDLDYDLNLLRPFQPIRPNYLRIEDVLVNYDENNEKIYFVSGYDLRKNKSFVTLVKQENVNYASLKYINNSTNFQIRSFYGNNYYYIKTQNGFVCKLDKNLNVVWLKLFNLDGTSRSLTEVTYNAFTNQVAFVAHSTDHPNAVGYLNNEFVSCKTVTVEEPQTLTARVGIRKARLSIEDTGVKIKTHQVTVQDHLPIELKLCFKKDGVPIKLSDEHIQSPFVYMQAAGSLGEDGSTQGIHLRWILKKELEKHLPKGDYATNNQGFNRDNNDFVHIYRAPYVKDQLSIDFSITPNLVVDNQQFWVYEINERVIHIRFANMGKYAEVRAQYNPLVQPMEFIKNYGDELIEIENKSALSFRVELEYTDVAASSSIQSELIVVEENKLITPKSLGARKTFSGTELSSNDNVKLTAENIRAVRYKSSNCTVNKINLELYEDFIEDANENRRWDKLGEFALTLDDTTALQRLEPNAGLVNGRWERFNDDAYVKISNYVDKWNGPTDPFDRNIKEVVQNYITLSDDATNPLAIEEVSFSEELPEGVTSIEQDTVKVSNLTLLQMASLDYHEARMMGLGTLDFSNEVQAGQFVYAMVYTTHGDLNDGLDARKVQHIYMTLPTAKKDERLPMPVDLKEPVFGLVSNNEGAPNVSLTDAEGYTDSGTARFISLFNEPLPDYPLTAFYQSEEEFNLGEVTFPVYAGIEYKKEEVGESNPWRKPELANTDKYTNLVPLGQEEHNETSPIIIPDEENHAMFVHREGENGRHIYSSYGINWFSRANESAISHAVVTQFKPKNTLIPPSNIKPVLIQKEDPLMFTAAQEQVLLENNGNEDKTLVRLTFDYNHVQEMKTYKVTPETMGSYSFPEDPNAIFPDSDEIFADEVEIFFRDRAPQQVTGKVTNINDDPSNELLAILKTGTYDVVSNGTQLVPELQPEAMANFVGGVFRIGEQQFIIHAVEASPEPNEGPIFTVFKQQVTDTLLAENPQLGGSLITPELTGDGLFFAVENMLNETSWGTTNPHSLKVKIGLDGWEVKRDVIVQEGPDDGLETIVEKRRGFNELVTIVEVLEPQNPNALDTNGDPIPQSHQGLYKITFEGFSLVNHPQHNEANPVQWYNGTVRVPIAIDPSGPKKVMDVMRIENIGTTDDLVLYAQDPSFGLDNNEAPMLGDMIKVNYYPGYKVYLYTDATFGLTEPNTLPDFGEQVRYTIFGLRSVEKDQPELMRSKISTPATMLARELSEPKRPQLPVGSLYATRPDTFGRATYTFTTQYEHKPHAILNYRASEFALLNALYEGDTITAIKTQLEGIENDTFYANRWQNLLGLEYTNGQFTAYPEEGGYRFPLPDKASLFEIINAAITKYNEDNATAIGLVTEVGAVALDKEILPPINGQAAVTMVDYVRFALFNAFVPLTEMPMIYQHIKSDPNYQPVAKKQVIRDRNGNVLSPTSPEFDMAPMAKKVGKNANEHKVLFTDFNLDGTSDNVYFYAAREMGNTMQLGEFSPVLGPVKLVNTKAPQTPEIKRVIPVLENKLLNIKPAIQFEINAYHKVLKIRKIKLYRTLDPKKALSVRTMDMVKEIDLKQAGLLTESIWKFKDEFDDLGYVPYGDPLYYKVVVLREVEYAEKNGDIVTEYAPSLPSKLIMSTIVENENPEAPALKYNADVHTNPSRLEHVIIKWNKTVHNGKYHLYKMNKQGNWVKIHEIVSNDQTFQLLLADTGLAEPTLALTNADGNPIYHHFKMEAENSAGMFSIEEKIMTIPNSQFEGEAEGIANMEVNNTFIVRGQ